MRRTLATARIPGADGLRAIACLLVIWHHTAQKLNPEGLSPLVGVLHFLGMRGEVGVSLFFVLSGAGSVEGRPYRKHTTIHLKAGEAASLVATTATELLQIGLPQF